MAQLIDDVKICNIPLEHHARDFLERAFSQVRETALDRIMAIGDSGAEKWNYEVGETIFQSNYSGVKLHFGHVSANSCQQGPQTEKVGSGRFVSAD